MLPATSSAFQHSQARPWNRAGRHMFGLLFGHQSRGVSRRVGFSDGSHNCCTLEDVFPFAFEVQICDLCQSCRATITQTRRSFAVL